MSSEYWAERQARAQEIITQKNTAEIERQLAKYYKRSLAKISKEFELTYKTFLLNVEQGLESSPATLYRMDTYWQMQSQLREELLKLGEKQIALFNKQFVAQYEQIYRAAAIVDNLGGFDAVSVEAAAQIINAIWCADGSTWASRIWKNTDKLQEALNQGLVDCVVSGANSNRLKQRLVEEFSVSFSRADNIVRTELNHIQTQAARKRYEDAGITEVEVWADKDERRCDICGKLHQKRYPVGAQMPIPAHPRCRCRILPVVEVKPIQYEQLKLEGI